MMTLLVLALTMPNVTASLAGTASLNVPRGCPPLAAVLAQLRDSGFRVAGLSGDGPALFALGRPEADCSGESAAAFAVRLAAECAESAGVPVRVWPVQFTGGPRLLAAAGESPR